MRESIGGSMLLYLVIIIVTAVMLLFSSILTYSKAYKIKNRIIEIIEKYGTYEKRGSVEESDVALELNSDLAAAGYNASNPTRCESVRKRLISGDNARYSMLGDNENTHGYNYCIFRSMNINDGYSYVVVTFVEFQIPIIGDVLTFPVYGETKILGKNYNY